MEIIIDEIVSNVRVVDREGLLAPETMRQIVGACLRAVREERAHDQRSAEERSVDGPLAARRGGDR